MEQSTRQPDFMFHEDDNLFSDKKCWVERKVFYRGLFRRLEFAVVRIDPPISCKPEWFRRGFPRLAHLHHITHLLMGNRIVNSFCNNYIGVTVYCTVSEIPSDKEEFHSSDMEALFRGYIYPYKEKSGDGNVQP